MKCVQVSFVFENNYLVPNACLLPILTSLCCQLTVKFIERIYFTYCPNLLLSIHSSSHSNQASASVIPLTLPITSLLLKFYEHFSILNLLDLSALLALWTLPEAFSSFNFYNYTLLVSLLPPSLVASFHSPHLPLFLLLMWFSRVSVLALSNSTSYLSLLPLSLR